MVPMKSPKKPESPPDVLREDQFKTLLATCEKASDFESRRDTALIRCFIDTGARLSEITNLRLNVQDEAINDVDLDQGIQLSTLIRFHQSHYRRFEAYYTECVMTRLNPEFPDLVSYNRFVELTLTLIIPLLAYHQQCQGTCSGIFFVDATTIKVCHNRRILHHKVFADLAERVKPQLAGSMILNSIWLSATRENCRPVS